MDLYKYHHKPEKLHGHHEADDIVHDRIKHLLQKSKNLVKINEKQKKSISRNAEMSYLYALQQRERFPEGEEVISKDPNWALYYAQDVIKGPWPEAEDTIAKDPETTVDYAIAVLKKRFPKGEQILLKSGETYQIINYVREVLKKPWPAAEPIILKSKNVSYMFEYAEMTGKRFLPAEKFIAKDPLFVWHYADILIKGEWPEAEDTIAKSAQKSYWYSELIKKRFKKGEKVIKGSYYEVRYENLWGIQL